MGADANTMTRPRESFERLCTCLGLLDEHLVNQAFPAPPMVRQSPMVNQEEAFEGPGGSSRGGMQKHGWQSSIERIAQQEARRMLARSPLSHGRDICTCISSSISNCSMAPGWFESNSYARDAFCDPVWLMLASVKWQRFCAYRMV